MKRISQSLHPKMLLGAHELFRHVIVFGATGCGKTRHIILPILAKLLARDKDNPDQRSGALVMDVKGDMDSHLRAVMQATGRTDEIITIGRNGTAWFDMFSGLGNDSRTVAERLMEVVRGIHPQHGGSDYDDFWIENLRRFLQVSAVLAHARGFGDLGGIMGVADAASSLVTLRSSQGNTDDVDDDDENESSNLKGLLEVLCNAQAGGLITHAEAEMAKTYLRTDAVGLPVRTWSTICNYAQSYLSCLKDSTIAKVLTPAPAQYEFVADEIFDHGRVVLVSLSRLHFGPGAEVFRNLIKSSFQICALQRHCRGHFNGKTLRPVNPMRPVFFVGDEFPSLLTPGFADDGDAFFLDKARESRVGCILSAQSVAALNARMQSSARTNHLLNNCVTKFFIATDCPETIRYFEGAVPELPNEGEALHHIAPAPPAFRLPNYNFAAPSLWVPISKAGGRQPRPAFSAGVLRELQIGEAIVLQSGGRAKRMCFPAFSWPR